MPYSHVAASAARCRRDHCLLWTRLVTAAARRRLGEPAVPAKRGGNGWLLASRIGSNALYTTVQVRDGGSPTSAVHGPRAPPGAFVRLGGSLCTYAWNTPRRRCSSDITKEEKLQRLIFDLKWSPCLLPRERVGPSTSGPRTRQAPGSRCCWCVKLPTVLPLYFTTEHAGGGDKHTYTYTAELSHNCPRVCAVCVPCADPVYGDRSTVSVLATAR